MKLTIEIVGEGLATVDFGERGAGAGGRSRLFLGIQESEEVLDCVSADTETATFHADFTVSPLPDGATNFGGPYAHGTRTARFCYLCWQEKNDDNILSRFGRIKIPLSFLPWERVEAAARAGTPIALRFSLVGKKGGPVFASVPVNSLSWEG